MVKQSNPVLIIGDLCNYDLVLAELLYRFNIPVKVFRTKATLLQDKSYQLDMKYPLKEIQYINKRNEIEKYIKRNTTIINLTNSLSGFLGKYRYLKCLALKNIRLINCPMGSDITELAVEKSLRGLVYRWLWRKAKFNFVPPYPKALDSIKLLRGNYKVIRYPYLLPKPRTGETKEVKQSIRYLMVSNLDFGINDSGKHRNSTKGNDRFIRSMIKAIQSGANVTCTIIDRGPDKEIAKEIVSSSNVSSSFSWVSPPSREELFKLMQAHDVIVDQFDVGGFGMSAMEAMGLSKPVMIFIDSDCWPLVYPDEPPVINCQSEDDIYHAMMGNQDKLTLSKLGETAFEWVKKYHDIQNADFSEVISQLSFSAGMQ